MRTRQVIGTLLIVIGLISLLWGGISWTRQRPSWISAPSKPPRRERETIPMPPIVGGLLLASGVVLLVIRPRQRA